MRNKHMLVDKEFADKVRRAQKDINKSLEDCLGVTFPQDKPVTIIDVTRIVARDIKPKKLKDKFEIDLKRFKVKI